MIDSLANSLSNEYQVSILCPYGKGVLVTNAAKVTLFKKGIRYSRFSQVDYYLIDKEIWENSVIDLISYLKPDIIHNCAEPEIITKIKHKPKKTIYTFDQAEFLKDKEEFLKEYNFVTTSSINYAKEVLSQDTKLATILKSINFQGITAGILDTIFDPSKGFLIPASYSSNNLLGKEKCKEYFKEKYGLKKDLYLCLTMCRLIKEKGLDDIIDNIDIIHQTGGLLVIIGKGQHEYEQKFRKMKRSEGVMYIDSWASPFQAAPLAAAADFYLCPSKSEVCGLMPMTASCYGAIPIVTQNGGLKDNFNEDNAIIIGEEGLADAVKKAASLYQNKELFKLRQKHCMQEDYSWDTRKSKYIELYEK